MSSYCHKLFSLFLIEIRWAYGKLVSSGEKTNGKLMPSDFQWKSGRIRPLTTMYLSEEKQYSVI